MSEIPSDPPKEIPFNEVPRGLLQNWQMASWLEGNDAIKAKLSSGGTIGITRDELKTLESLSSRVTTSDDDPPIYLLYERPDTSGNATFNIQRYSQTKDQWENILIASGNIRENTLSISTQANRDQVLATSAPILNKVGDNKVMLATRVCENSKQPNRLLMRSYFATIPTDAYWLQLDSPVSDRKKETSDQPLYRVYINPEINSLDQYNEVAAPIVKVAREYKQKGLSFKLMYGGEGGKKVALDPKATKIVFYFNNSEDAVNLGNYLENAFSQDSDLIKVNAEERHEENYFPQKSWRNGLIILGKGTREERQDVTQRLQRQDISAFEKQRLMRKAENLSILIE